MKFSLRPIKLDLKVNWKISRNESLSKQNFVVALEDGPLKGMGEVAPNIRYGESPKAVQAQFDKIPDFASPENALEFAHEEDLFHSLKCGLVCAAVELLSKKKNISIEKQLNVAPVETLATSMSVPIMEENLLKDYMSSIARFPYVKVKVNQDNAASFTQAVARYSDNPIRVDANEAFESSKSFMDFLLAVKDLNIQFIEQPFKASDAALYREIKGKSPFEIMADESIEDAADFDSLAAQFDSVNIKLMKTGGYLKALELIQKAREKKLKVMLGCMIESSLGIACAMRLGSLADYFDLDGSLLIKNDPFQNIIENNGRLSLN
ncbi:MAG: enolase C-terminal domain-like protein [Bacteriovoracaceae bacterium]